MTPEQLKDEEEQLRSQVNQLSNDTRKTFYQQQQQRIKDPDTYAVLNWFFVTGLHHFYLANNPRGMVNLTLMLIGLLLIESVGLLLILLVFLIELPQLFNSQQIVHAYNNRVMKTLLHELQESNKLSSS
ncbi:TM2 domain-containing protein [Pseudoalteromonas mariniglutinosa]|uniref:TM2 domain-containing protein n=1 Tax=Pseudoalteromonas mariniglutinosa TaxID=206042 RepID=UPI00384E673E